MLRSLKTMALQTTDAETITEEVVVENVVALTKALVEAENAEVILLGAEGHQEEKDLLSVHQEEVKEEVIQEILRAVQEKEGLEEAK